MDIFTLKPFVLSIIIFPNMEFPPLALRTSNLLFTFCYSTALSGHEVFIHQLIDDIIVTGALTRGATNLSIHRRMHTLHRRRMYSPVINE
jgi:hypothetical protein